MTDREPEFPEEQRIKFRIGVNLGDAIVDGDDIYGDGVNIAVRLEGLAAPGSICISGTVRDHVGDRLPYVFVGHAPFSGAGILSKAGWEVAARIECEPPGHTRFYMTKKLS